MKRFGWVLLILLVVTMSFVPAFALAPVTHGALLVADATATPPTLGIQVKILAVAGIVFSALQAAKKAFPGIGGWAAVALNIALTILGVVVVVQPGQLFSAATLIAVLQAFFVAAGTHGLWKFASN